MVYTFLPIPGRWYPMTLYAYFIIISTSTCMISFSFIASLFFHALHSFGPHALLYPLQILCTSLWSNLLSHFLVSMGNNDIQWLLDSYTSHCTRTSSSRHTSFSSFPTASIRQSFSHEKIIHVPHSIPFSEPPLRVFWTAARLSSSESFFELLSTPRRMLIKLGINWHSKTRFPLHDGHGERTLEDGE